MKYRFSDCILDVNAHTLSRGGVLQDVEPQVFDFLHLLVRNPGVLISRDQLIKEVWGGRIVSESAISARISALRRVVGDNGKQQSIVRTVARRGVQFVADLSSDEPPETTPTSTASQPGIRFATADDGVKIAFATSGAGPPIFRVQHRPSHLEIEWNEPTDRAMFDRISESHTLIRFDQRGSGLSDLDIQDFSMMRAADDMKSVADQIGLERFAVFGNSSGVQIAVQFAAKYPDYVSHLILQSGYVDGRSIRNGGSKSDEPDTILKMAKEGWDTPGSAFVSGYLSVYFPTATREQIELIAENLQKSCPAENEVRGRTYFNNNSIADLLGEVQAPALVFHSRGDEVHPLSEGQKLARGISDAQLFVLESRNHYPFPQEDCWQQMMAAIDQFLKD